MQINNDLSSNPLAQALQPKRPESASANGRPDGGLESDSTAGQLDPSFQRLSEAPSSVQDSDFDIQDESQAGQVMSSLLQSMRSQPGMTLASQAGQSSSNVLSLLQPAD